ncbi:hypothetical protein [Clostridium sp. SM-530-WT-3G]|uniref:hypothetical protein n=1 Tax=Clostridium sp. SM-530-WT-3G TaxID=2725303 RepID=UPI00145E130C|nr:hypothetical protein [Clostridium sp. SM-530-WT-3G]NME83372.1 hypothetical protein [Clostridium sp. SM-530-WT-3G]
MIIVGLVAILFAISFILILIDRNSSEINLVPVRVKNSGTDIREKLENADIDELKRLGMM